MIAAVPVTVEDTVALSSIHQAAFGSHAWSESMLGASIAHESAWGLKLTSDGQAIGFALCQQIGDECEIMTFAVAGPWQRRGHGGHLLQALYDAAKSRNSRRIVLEVAADNTAARRLYTGFGFEKMGIRPGYYEREDASIAAVLMEFKINRP
ncbi:MAG: ribosomal protein S18-alanine N-acetyltransferase [Alphaproteobacteria bacterium]